MIQFVELNDKYFCAFNDSKDEKNFRLSNTARKIFLVAQIFDVTLPNFTNGRAIAPPLPPCLLRLCVSDLASFSQICNRLRMPGNTDLVMIYAILTGFLGNISYCKIKICKA